MALSALVSKKAVLKILPKLWKITLAMILTEDSVEVFQSDYSELYRTGDSITIKEEAPQAQMQKDRDDYKSEQNIFNNAQLDTIVTNINAGLGV